MLFSEHPLESCLNDPLTLECEVGLFLLDLRVGGLVPALPRGRAWTTQYLYCPTGLQGTSGSTSGTSFATNQGFRSLLHAAALGEYLVTLTCSPASCPSPPEPGDPAVLEGDDIGGGEVSKPPVFLKVVL